MKANTAVARCALAFAVWMIKRVIMIGVMFAALYYIAYQNHLDYERTKGFDTITTIPDTGSTQPARGSSL